MSPGCRPEAREATSLQARRSEETLAFSASLLPPACCLPWHAEDRAAPLVPTWPDRLVSGRVCVYKAKAQPGFFGLVVFFFF